MANLHTPGPWHWRAVYDKHRETALLLETAHRPVDCNDPVIFAIREDWLGRQSSEREAAKQLIAAAPQLLAACEALLSLWEAQALSGNSIDITRWKLIDNACQKAREAIDTAQWPYVPKTNPITENGTTT